MSDDIAGTCQECGASVYQQHLSSGIARNEDDKLLCPHCVTELKRSGEAGGADDEIFEPIELDSDDDETHVDMSHSRIRAATTATLGSIGGWDDTRFNRQLDPRAVSSTRCRTFHSKLSEAALEFMNNQINEWIDKEDNLSIKFATSTIGTFEGKHSEPNLILTLFY